jgi:aryl-phospho-beta-D-glucosidase BglC (GH1 family)
LRRLAATASTRIALGLLGLALLLALAGARCGTDVSTPWVRTANCGFVDTAGDPVVLRGFDLIAPQAPGVWAAAVRSGANFVRLPVAWSDVEPRAPDGSHRWNERLLGQLDREIRFFRSHRISVLLDFHQFRWSPYFSPEAQGIPAWFYEKRDYPRSSAGKTHALADWWTDDGGLRAYTAFAQMMAQRYSAYPNVIGYEVFNEPATGDLGETREVTQAVLAWEARVRQAIRAIDPLRTIFVQTRGGGDLGLKQADFGVFGSLDRLAVDLHSYFNGENGTGYSQDGERWMPDWAGAHLHDSRVYVGSAAKQEELLNVALSKTRQLGIPLLVGEWGVHSTDPNGDVYQRQMLRLFARNGLSWARWDLGTNPSFGLLAPEAGARNLLAQLRETLAKPVAPAGTCAP